MEKGNKLLEIAHKRHDYTEVLDAITEKALKIKWSDCDWKGKSVIVVRSFFFTIIAPTIVGLGVGVHWYQSTGLESSIAYEDGYDLKGMNVSGTGGPDFTPLAAGFLSIDTNNSCDGEELRLESGEQSTMLIYASTTPIGTKFEFDVTPTGREGANVLFGRPGNVYEIAIGENSYAHMSVKVGSGGSLEMLHVYPLGEEPTGNPGRIKLKNVLSSSTANSIRIEEQKIGGEYLRLHITINAIEYVTDDFYVPNRDKHQTIYLALRDGSKGLNNRSGLIAPKLRICPR